MTIQLSLLTIGDEYHRSDLAALFGYSSYEALSRGIFTPRDLNIIMLFATEKKQLDFIQYEDSLDNGILIFEGERNHKSDHRLINSENNGDIIVLFHRIKHHMPFTYYGSLRLVSFEQKVDLPSRFKFKIVENIIDENLETELLTHGLLDDIYFPESEGKEILCQHIRYERSSKNRKKAIDIHGTTCVVCGFNFDKKYGKELAKEFIEIHHVRSLSKMEMIVNPDTDLVPLCSNCHSMVHRRKGEILSIEILKELIEE